jgi:hypothetical protein
MTNWLMQTWDKVLAHLRGISEVEAWQATGCLGWTVRDLTFHMLADAQRALVALGTPRDGPVDTDAVTYWQDWQPSSDRAQNNVRMIRIVASVYPSFASLREEYEETVRAAAHIATRVDLDRPVGTQGHVLRVEDLMRTLIVEAAVHHLDLLVALPGPPPGADALRVVRETLDGLLGQPGPSEWDDITYAKKGTGRSGITSHDRSMLGGVTDRLPLFG